LLQRWSRRERSPEFFYPRYPLGSWLLLKNFEIFQNLAQPFPDKKVRNGPPIQEKFFWIAVRTALTANRGNADIRCESARAGSA
jgi:hypothetical protein